MLFKNRNTILPIAFLGLVNGASAEVLINEVLVDPSGLMAVTNGLNCVTMAKKILMFQDGRLRREAIPFRKNIQCRLGQLFLQVGYLLLAPEHLVPHFKTVEVRQMGFDWSMLVVP